LLPPALLWLAVHAVLLAVILSVRFLTAKTVALLLMFGAVLWFLTRRRPQALLAPPEMV
jgi:hypothetical protein